jgi:hypothetical protein
MALKKNNFHNMAGALMLLALPATAIVRTYPAPQDMPRAQGIHITADGEEVFAYEVHVNLNQPSDSPTPEPAPAAYFDFSDSVQVVVRRDDPIASVVVRPLSWGIVPLISGDSITFTLYQPAKLSVEFNDELHGALHLFADSIESNPPQEGDEGVRYYGPGIHNTDITLQSDQTVYLAGGAVVRGNIRGDNIHNSRIMGRGMLNGGTINFSNCSDIEVNGIHNFRPFIQGWMATVSSSNRVSFIDYKSIGCGQNSDGIDPVSSQDVVIRDCFMRQWDDIFPIKAWSRNVRNVEISECILWSDRARVFEIGYETRCDTIRDVYIHDCTVIHALSRAVISINNADHAYITNIRYENITVEHANINDWDPFLINLWIGTSNWGQDNERGHINGVTIKNFSLLSGSFESCRISGYDDGHRVENITMENLKILDEFVTTPQDGKFNINQHSDNIDFLYTPAAVEISDEVANNKSAGIFEIRTVGSKIYTTFPGQNIGFSVPDQNKSVKEVRVYNLNGGLVRALPVRDGSAFWDGMTANGRTAPGGIYFARVR